MAPKATYRLWSDIRSPWCNYEVVGESYHIENIRRLYVPSWNREGEELHRDVELVPEPDNPYDEWAISVRADGILIGYLSREDAPAWAAVIRRITASGLTAVTDGRIYLYEAPDWDDLDRNDNPRMETRARVSIKLGDPELAVPLNDPPAVPYTLLPQSSVVQVTKEDEHFDTLFDYVPQNGRGLLYATLHEAVVSTARTSKAVVEVRVDNRRVGQLTPQMSQRFLPMIRHLEGRGLVPACQGDITGSTVAAEVRIDAVKANEADDATLSGSPVMLPVLAPALGDPRAYRVPAAYGGRARTIREVRPAPTEPVTLPINLKPVWNEPPLQPTAPGPMWNEARPPTLTPELASMPVPGPVRHIADGRRGATGSAQPPAGPHRRGNGAVLIAVLLIGGFFAVLIPYVGPVVWLAAWGAAIYLVVQLIRRALRARRHPDDSRHRPNGS